MSSPLEQELGRMLATLGWSSNPMGKLWAKLEILLGLLGVGAGFVLGTQSAHRPEAEVPPWSWLGPILLIILGGYLALAGHRSHLYQSNNCLTAYLAGLIRTASASQRPDHEHSG